MYETLLRPFEFVAGGLLETAADILSNDNSIEFRPAEEEISLPADLFAHSDVQTEWWYYTGHCRSDTGRDFGFELVFFKRRTDLDSLGIVPVRALANPMYFAHFGFSDITSQKFGYDHRRSFNKPFDLPVAMSECSYDLRLGSWTVREDGGSHILHAETDGLVFDAVLEAEKPLVLNGDSGNGISRKSSGASAHFSFPRMSVSGTLKDGSSTERFSGTAWMDREFGTWEQTDWDWFSVQFEDRTELMLYQYRTGSGEISNDSAGTLIDADGTCTYFERSDYESSVTSEWTSPKTGTKYPSGWELVIPKYGIETKIVPLIQDQELDTLGSTMIVYWEGACQVTGSRAGTPLFGRAYVELVGYDKSHEAAGLGDFLFGSQLRRLREMLS